VDANRASPHTFTVATNSLAESLLFYEQGWGLRVKGPLALSPDTVATQRRLWNLPADLGWATYLLHRDGVDYAAQLRLLVLDRTMPAFRSHWSATTLGPYTLGFPNRRQEAVDRELRELGFGALNALERTGFTAPDGRRYDIVETVHTGPDFVLGVGVARGPGEPGITPLNTDGMGGPGYSMMIVDDVEPMVRFMTEVIGYRVRTRKVWQSTGRKGALNLPDGTEFDFAQLAPHGDWPGFLVFIAFRNLAAAPPVVPPRLPNRGLVLYSIPVTDLDAALGRARGLGLASIIEPLPLTVPGMGGTRYATVLAPNGTMFELFELFE
jgi:catechol 2,3-dioxygenase-like lactoylglutathione lyase family enzyme